MRIKILILLAVLFGVMFSQIEAQNELQTKSPNKTKNTYTHSIGLAIAFDLREIQYGSHPGEEELELTRSIDWCFSFYDRGFFWSSLAPLWNLLPYYELGVNNKFFFKLEHFSTFRDVFWYNLTDISRSLNHSIYAHFRGNILHKIKNQKHKLLVGGMSGTNIYREKLINDTKFRIGFAPALFFGASVAYYYNFDDNFDVFFSIDHAMALFEGYRELIPLGAKKFNPAYSMVRVSVGLQYSFMN
jgi:hypothetical protein